MLNFKNVQKRYLKIAMADDSEISVGMPKKKLFAMLIDLKNGLNQASLEDLDTIDVLYDMTAELLSNNREKVPMTAEQLSEIFDIEDIQIFFNAYIDFVTGKLEADPN